MSRVFTIMLRKHGETSGLMLYQARAKSYNAAVLYMRVQGVVPMYDILSYTERPAKEFVLGILFPRTIQTKSKELEQANASQKKTFFMPVVCWFKRQHMLTTWQKNGSFCKRCKGVFPE